MLFDTIIIGGGPAGMSAALYLLRNNKKVLILEKEAFGGQIATSPRLENYPTIKSISGLEWANLFFEQISDLGAEFDIDEVTSLTKEGDKFTVVTKYHTYEAKTVIVANGVHHRPMGLPNEEALVGKGVSYCAVCDGPFYKGKDVNIIGDANTALQYALMLTNYCSSVHMFTLFDKFFGDQVLIDRVKSNEKITVTQNVSLKEMTEDGKGNLAGLKFVNTKTNEETIISTDNVFIAIGQIPHNEFLKDLVTLEKGLIVTNEVMETGVRGLYAAGDTRKKDIKQVVTACNDGAVAAMGAVKYLNTL